jgi:hypothetical protein
MHEVHLRLIEKEVVVKTGHLQTRSECRIHGWRDFILKHNSISHHHRALLGGSEGCPGTKSCERLEWHPIAQAMRTIPSGAIVGFVLAAFSITEASRREVC